MNDTNFKALVVREEKSGEYSAAIEKREIKDLPEGEVCIRVHYSSLNYKDALSAHGHRGISRHYPHTPGIDAAGVVIESQSQSFQIGEEVFVTGRDLGMGTAGGFGEVIRVPDDWVIGKPKSLNLKECMVYGTAGFTAAQCLLRLQMAGVKPDSGEILVTGATGGVGSMAVTLFAAAGYEVVASTGKASAYRFLKDIGAKEVVSRKEVDDQSNKPLLSGRWGGVVDTVGGNTLATAIKSTKYRGAIACLGLVQSAELHTSVYPFLLRGIQLLGIDSAECPKEQRYQIWKNLSGDWKCSKLEEVSREISLKELMPELKKMLDGQSLGRVVLKHDF